MLPVAKKTTHRCVAPTLCQDWSPGARWAGYLGQRYVATPGFLPGRLTTELFVRELAPRKGCSARPKHGLLQTRWLAACAQWSRPRSGRAARQEGVFRAVSPIESLPARFSSIDPGARVAFPNLWRALPVHQLTLRGERQKFARSA